MIELDGINVLKHNSIKIVKDLVIYIDPYQIDLPLHDADLILCTHSHYDHFSPEDILKIANESTVLITTEDCKESIEKLNFASENINFVKPNERLEFEDIIIETVPAYNKNKDFHPKKNQWVGYVIEIKNTRYYIAGDTDNVKEIRDIDCDVAFLPVGGTYTMNYIEAADLARKLMPKYVIPTHYALIVGDPEDGEKFKSLIDGKDTKCEIYI